MNDPQDIHQQWTDKQTAKHGVRRPAPVRAVPDEQVIRILGLPGDAVTGFDDQYVVEYDPSGTCNDPVLGTPMLCRLVTTPNLSEATRYTTAEVIELLRRVDASNPVRPDGKPNRPITAFHVLVATPEAEEKFHVR